nr:SDR family NAD(P)-dependent oxidoreductase [Limosilactobacillus fermentum]
MREQGGGRIIQIFSYGGQVAYPGNSLYHASKFGIEAGPRIKSVQVK